MPAVREVAPRLAFVGQRALHEPRRWSGSLRRLSFARNIQGSNSIEGYDAKLDDVAAVAMGEEPLDSTVETRLALEGYRNAMTYVLQRADDNDFECSAGLMKSLHFMMTGYSLANRPGRWRATAATRSALVIEIDRRAQAVPAKPEWGSSTQ